MAAVALVQLIQQWQLFAILRAAVRHEHVPGPAQSGGLVPYCNCLISY